jgi:hypothetical protein
MVAIRSDSKQNREKGKQYQAFSCSGSRKNGAAGESAAPPGWF